MRILPEQIGLWMQSGQVKFDAPHGIAVFFKFTEFAEATIYFYNGGVESIDPMPDSPQARNEFESARRQVFQILDGEACVEHDMEVVRLGEIDRAPLAWHTSLSEISGSHPKWTALYLTCVKDIFVKLRVTSLLPNNKRWQLILQPLLDAIGLRIQFWSEDPGIDSLDPDRESRINLWPLEAFIDPPGTIINSIGMKFVPIPPGEFFMGQGLLDDISDPNAAPMEEFIHKVRISRKFYLGMYAVTQGDFARVMGENPSLFPGKTRPVEHVCWASATEFCRRLSAFPEEQAAGREYRLPTEAEWEYACRAGTTDKFNVGAQLSARNANFSSDLVDSPEPTVPVGTFPPNSWGLFEMHGNVWEWCADWFDASYYERSPVDDPPGPDIGTHHVLRGGSASTLADECRSSIRGEAASDGPDPEAKGRFEVYGDFGFRVICYGPNLP